MILMTAGTIVTILSTMHRSYCAEAIKTKLIQPMATASHSQVTTALLPSVVRPACLPPERRNYFQQGREQQSHYSQHSWAVRHETNILPSMYVTSHVHSKNVQLTLGADTLMMTDTSPSQCELSSVTMTLITGSDLERPTKVILTNTDLSSASLTRHNFKWANIVSN